MVREPEESNRRFWKDGRVLDWVSSGTVSLLTHTLHYGLGVFEGIRAYERPAPGGGRTETAIFRLDEHVKRLFGSAKIVLMEPRVTEADVKQGAAAVLRENRMSEGYIRPLMILGEGPMGLLPTENPVETYIIAWKWGAYLGAEGLENGIRCKVSSIARPRVNTAMPRGKIVGQYVNSTLAKQEAKLSGYDEALLLDANGYVSEGSGENLFIVEGGRLVTPPLSAAILPGITRDTVMVLAREEGIDVVEQTFTRDAVYLADEVFLTGTAAELTPVREVDGRRIGNGKAGEITKLLQRRYFEIVRGSDDSHLEWLTRI